MARTGPSRARRPELAYADTNIFVGLLVGPAHPLHEAALGLFRRVAEGAVNLIVTSIVVAELVYVSRALLGWSRQQASDELAALLEADGLIVPELAVLLRALHLYREHDQLDLADAYLAAAALEVGPPAVATFDRDFQAIPSVRVVSA